MLTPLSFLMVMHGIFTTVLMPPQTHAQQRVITSHMPLRNGESETIYLATTRSDGTIQYLQAGLKRLEGYLFSLVTELEQQRPHWPFWPGAQHHYETEEAIFGLIPADLMPEVLQNKGLFIEHVLDEQNRTSPAHLAGLRQLCTAPEADPEIIDRIQVFAPFICAEGDLAFRHYLELYRSVYELPLLEAMRRELRRSSADRRAAVLLEEGRQELKTAALTLAPFVTLRRLTKFGYGSRFLGQLRFRGRPLPKSLHNLLQMWVAPAAGTAVFYSAVNHSQHWLAEALAEAAEDAHIDADEWLEIRKASAFYGWNGQKKVERNAAALEALLASPDFPGLSAFIDTPFVKSYLLEPIHRFDLRTLEDGTWFYDTDLLWLLKHGASEEAGEALSYYLESSTKDQLTALAPHFRKSPTLAELLALVLTIRSSDTIRIEFLEQEQLKPQNPADPAITLAEKPILAFDNIMRLVEGLWFTLKPSGPLDHIREYASEESFLAAESAEQVLVAYLTLLIAKELEMEKLPGSGFQDLVSLQPERFLQRQHLTFMQRLLPDRAEQLRFTAILQRVRQERSALYRLFRPKARQPPDLAQN